VVEEAVESAGWTFLREADLLFDRVFAGGVTVPFRVWRRSSADDSPAGVMEEAVEEEEFWRDMAVVGVEGPFV
jgi:hypothetical protein